MTTTDIIVIGSGPTGENVGQYAHDGGLDVVLVDADLFGGECSYYACMPSKALLRPIDVVATSRHLPGVTPTTLDRDALLTRRDAWVSHYDDAGQVLWAQNAGLDVVRGHARLIGPRAVEVTSADGMARRLEATTAVVLATGSTPVVPPVFADVAPWSSRDATGVRETPERLVIVGGGVVAGEAATWMAALGTRVTMLVRGDRLLAPFEPFAGEAVLASLQDLGVEVRFATQVLEARRDEVFAGTPDSPGGLLGKPHGGTVKLTLSAAAGRTETLQTDEVLVATGRRPRLDDVGLETLGLTPDDILGRERRGSASQDAPVQVPMEMPEWLHAIGDAGPGAPLTHMGKYEARVLGARLAGRDETAVPDSVPVPQVVFTDPQVASVGLTAAAARAAGHDVVAVEVPFASAAGTSLLRDDGVGRANLVVDAERGVVLGATFVGHEAAELLHAATIAIVGQVPVGLLRHAVPAYPTASELWLRLLEELPTTMR